MQPFKVKYSKSNNTYQIWKGEHLVIDFSTKSVAEREAKRLNLLYEVQLLDKTNQNSNLKGRSLPPSNAFSKQEIQMMVNALNYLGNKWLDELRKGRTMDSIFEGNEHKERAAQYHLLAEKIEKLLMK